MGAEVFVPVVAAVVVVAGFVAGLHVQILPLAPSGGLRSGQLLPDLQGNRLHLHRGIEGQNDLGIGRENKG